MEPASTTEAKKPTVHISDTGRVWVDPREVLTSSPPFFRNAKDHGPSAHYRTGIPTAFFKLFILKNHFGGFLLHPRCMLYPFELGMANVSSI